MPLISTTPFKIIGYGIDNPQHEGDLSIPQIPYEMHFKPDGTEVFLLYEVAGVSRVDGYPLSTPWDITTGITNGSPANTYSFSPIARGLSFKTDGTVMYASESFNDDALSFTLSTPWNLTTASPLGTFDLTAGGGPFANTAMSFKPDGTLMFVFGGTGAPGDGNNLYEYDVSPAWDISGVGTTYTGTKLNLNAIFPGVADFAFHPNGSAVYLLNTSGGLQVMALSTAWDIATASVSITGSVSSFFSSTPGGLAFSADGRKMYVAGVVSGSDRRIRQYNVE